MTASADALQHIGESVRTQLADAHSYVFFDDSGKVLASSLKVGDRMAMLHVACMRRGLANGHWSSRWQRLLTARAACVAPPHGVQAFLYIAE